MSVIVKYWPAVVAGLYLLYTLAAGHTTELPAAISAFVAALGLNKLGLAAHARVDALK
jgi:hypothetical protein